jgi:hypothetical protein
MSCPRNRTLAGEVGAVTDRREGNAEGVDGRELPGQPAAKEARRSTRVKHRGGRRDSELPFIHPGQLTIFDLLGEPDGAGNSADAGGLLPDLGQAEPAGDGGRPPG